MKHPSTIVLFAGKSFRTFLLQALTFASFSEKQWHQPSKYMYKVKKDILPGKATIL